MEKKYCQIGLNSLKPLKDYRYLLKELDEKQLLFLDYLVDKYNKKGEYEPLDENGMGLIGRFIEGLSDVEDFISEFKDLEFDQEFFSVEETSTLVHSLIKIYNEPYAHHNTFAMLERTNSQQDYQEFLIAVGYNEDKNDWDYGEYFGTDKGLCLKEFQKRVKLELSEIKIKPISPCYLITINGVEYKFTNIIDANNSKPGYKIGNQISDIGVIGKMEHLITPSEWENRKEIK